MTKQHVYILTDCHRKHLHIGLTENITDVISLYKQEHDAETIATTFRLIYVETYAEEDLALQRYHRLLIYTRAQKERLIRNQNPNWSDLDPQAALNPYLRRALDVSQRTGYCSAC